MSDWHTRYRRLIDAYRTKLMEVDHLACKSVDIRVEDWGEGWVTSDALVDFSVLMTAAEIADKFGLARHDIQNWSRRHPDLIPVRGQKGNRNLYMLRDVLIYRNAKNRNHDRVNS